jgi:hypothetical protein
MREHSTGRRHAAGGSDDGTRSRVFFTPLSVYYYSNLLSVTLMPYSFVLLTKYPSLFPYARLVFFKKRSLANFFFFFAFLSFFLSFFSLYFVRGVQAWICALIKKSRSLNTPEHNAFKKENAPRKIRRNIGTEDSLPPRSFSCPTLVRHKCAVDFLFHICAILDLQVHGRSGKYRKVVRGEALPPPRLFFRPRLFGRQSLQHRAS